MFSLERATDCFVSCCGTILLWRMHYVSIICLVEGWQCIRFRLDWYKWNRKQSLNVRYVGRPLLELLLFLLLDIHVQKKIGKKSVILRLLFLYIFLWHFSSFFFCVLFLSLILLSPSCCLDLDLIPPTCDFVCLFQSC